MCVCVCLSTCVSMCLCVCLCDSQLSGGQYKAVDRRLKSRRCWTDRRTVGSLSVWCRAFIDKWCQWLRWSVSGHSSWVSRHRSRLWQTVNRQRRLSCNRFCCFMFCDVMSYQSLWLMWLVMCGCVIDNISDGWVCVIVVPTRRSVSIGLFIVPTIPSVLWCVWRFVVTFVIIRAWSEMVRYTVTSLVGSLKSYHHFFLADCHTSMKIIIMLHPGAFPVRKICPKCICGRMRTPLGKLTPLPTPLF